METKVLTCWCWSKICFKTCSIKMQFVYFRSE